MQRSFGNSEEITCQICFKTGHTADVCWNRFVEDYMPTPRGFGNGKGPKAAYFSNFEGFTPYQGYEDNDNLNYMSPNAYSSSTANSYSGSDSYIPAAAFVANCEGPADDGWYLDSGATHHLTNNMDNLHLGEEYKGMDKLIIGNGQGLHISHIGNSFLSYRASSHSNLKPTHTAIALKDMLLVPSITKNLLSISRLTTDNPLSVEFCGNVCFVNDMKGQVLLQGFAEKCLYKLLLKTKNSSPASVMSHFQLNKPVSMLSFFNVPSISHNCTALNKACYHAVQNNCNQKSDDMTILHRRFGHPSSVILMHLLNFCSKLKVSQKSVLSSAHVLCEACQLGKVHKHHFPATETKTKQVLELIHTDLCGPSPTVSKNGYRYYISFIDDYSIYTWIYPLKLKSEAFEVFKLFKIQVENQFNTQIKMLQSDWGGEYRVFNEFLNQNGILFRHSCPYTHHQNGLVERKHRHIVELRLTLLA